MSYSSGKDHYLWKGGKYVSNRGYVIVNVGKGKQIPEHILVMEKHLGRKLRKGEIVHHVDETFKGRSKNDISNLELTNRPEHTSHHHKGKGKGFCVSFDSFTNRYRLEIGNRSTRKQYSLGECETREKALQKAYDMYGHLIPGKGGIMEVIDRKFKFKAVSNKTGKQYTEKNAIVFLVKDRLLPELLLEYENLCEKYEVDERQLKGIQLLRERVERYHEAYPQKISLPDVDEGEEEKRVCKPNKD